MIKQTHQYAHPTPSERMFFENVGAEPQTASTSGRILLWPSLHLLCQQLPRELIQHLFPLCPFGRPVLSFHIMKGSKMKDKRGNVLSCNTFTWSFSINTAKKRLIWGGLSNSRQWPLVKENLDINLNQVKFWPSSPAHHHHHHQTPVPLFQFSAGKASTGLFTINLREVCGAALAVDAEVKCGVSFVSWATGFQQPT